MDTVERGEMAEKQLDAMIRRRHDQRRKTGEEERIEDAWKESERREAARRRRENGVGWYAWHAHRAELFARWAAEHAAKAEALLEPEQRRAS